MQGALPELTAANMHELSKQNLIAKECLLKIFLTMLLAALLLSSCTITPVPQAPVGDSGATLYLYLQPLPQEAQRLTLTILELNAHSSDGRDIPLLTEPLQLNPAQHINRQAKLLTVKLPPGDYLGLSLAIKEATLDTEAGKIALLTATAPQLIKEKFLIRPDRAQTLFLSLNPDRLVTAGYRLTAHFSLRKPQPPLPGLKGLVSHPSSGTLTVFEKKTPAVTSVLAVGSRPTGLVLDQSASKAYLAQSGENSIAVVDLIHEQIQQKIRLRPADHPEQLALSSDAQALIVTNPGSDSVSIIGTDSLSERQRILFSTRPAAVFTGSNGRRAYVVLPEANALVAVDLSRATQIATVTLMETPFRGISDGIGKQLYLLAEDSPNLLVVDSATLAIENRIFIGFGARCLALNKNNGLVYIGLRNGDVAIVDPQIGLPIDSFRTGEEVIDIVPDLEQNSLFILTGKEPQLEKYDLVSKRRLAILDLAATGYEMVVMGER